MQMRDKYALDRVQCSMITNPIKTNIRIALKTRTDVACNLYLVKLAQGSVHLLVMNTEMNLRIL